MYHYIYTSMISFKMFFNDQIHSHRQVTGWPPSQRHQLRRGSTRAPWASTWPSRPGPAGAAGEDVFFFV